MKIIKEKTNKNGNFKLVEMNNELFILKEFEKGMAEARIRLNNFLKNN